MSEVVDEPFVDSVGIWVQDASKRWHRSIAFDGYDHDLACGIALTASNGVAAVDQDLSHAPDTGEHCEDCLEYWRAAVPPQEIAHRCSEARKQLGVLQEKAVDSHPEEAQFIEYLIDDIDEVEERLQPGQEVRADGGEESCRWGVVD